MAIYSRFGSPVTIVRAAVIEDVKKYDNRRPDKRDRSRVEDGGYLIARHIDTGKEYLTDIAFLRADGGLGEIVDAIEALYPTRPQVVTVEVDADDIGRKSGEPDYSRDHVS